MKRFKVLGALALILGAGLFATAYSARTDIFSLVGGGVLRAVDVFRITSTGDVKITDSSSYTAHDIDSTTGETTIYNGDINLGGIGTTPTSSAANYGAITIQLKNDDSSSWAIGSLIAVDDDCAGCGKLTTANDQTDWVGFAQEVVAAGSVGKVVISGYALALTTGTVNRGDVLVSTATTPSSPGYTAADTTPTTGADVAVAIASGTAAGGTTLVKVR